MTSWTDKAYMDDETIPAPGRSLLELDLGFGAAHLDDLGTRLLRVGRDEDEPLRSLVDEIAAEVGQLQAVLAPTARV